MFNVGDTLKLLPPFNCDGIVFTIVEVLPADDESGVPMSYLLDEYVGSVDGRYLEEVE